MQKGSYRFILSLALVCLLNVMLNAAATAQEHHRGDGDPATRAGGKVTAIDSASITVEGRDGKTNVITVTSDTQYMRNGQSAQLADFKVGDFVGAHGARNADGQFVADRVMGGDKPPQHRKPPSAQEQVS